MIDIMDELRRKFGNVEELKVAVVSNQGRRTRRQQTGAGRSARQ